MHNTTAVAAAVTAVHLTCSTCCTHTIQVVAAWVTVVRLACTTLANVLHMGAVIHVCVGCTGTVTFQ